MSERARSHSRRPSHNNPRSERGVGRSSGLAPTGNTSQSRQTAQRPVRRNRGPPPAAFENRTRNMQSEAGYVSILCFLISPIIIEVACHLDVTWLLMWKRKNRILAEEFASRYDAGRTERASGERGRSLTRAPSVGSRAPSRAVSRAPSVASHAPSRAGSRAPSVASIAPSRASSRGPSWFSRALSRAGSRAPSAVGSRAPSIARYDLPLLFACDHSLRVSNRTVRSSSTAPHGALVRANTRGHRGLRRMTRDWTHLLARLFMSLWSDRSRTPCVRCVQLTVDCLSFPVGFWRIVFAGLATTTCDTLICTSDPGASRC